MKLSDNLFLVMSSFSTDLALLDLKALSKIFAVSIILQVVVN